jgi:hypothetical protein
VVSLLTGGRGSTRESVKSGVMAGEPSTAALHEQVADALERGARAQEHSRALIEDHVAVESALHDTLAAISLRRNAERASVPE